MSDSRKDQQQRFLSQAIQLEETINPKIVRTTIYLICMTVASFIGWASVANISEVARAPGEVVPRGYQQVVQHLEGGIVRSIHVKDGEVVDAGQTLLVLDGAGLYEDRARSVAKAEVLADQEERLRAFLDGRDIPSQTDFKKVDAANPVSDQLRLYESMKRARENEQAIVTRQITQKENALSALRTEMATAQSNLSLAERLFEKQRLLNEKGYLSEMDVLQAEQSVNGLRGSVRTLESRLAEGQSTLSEFRARLSSLSANQKDDLLEKLETVVSERRQNAALIDKIDERIARLDIKAPVKGFVKGMNVNTVGGIVQPGRTVMEIIPLDEPMEVQVKISPEDIGHVHPGQNVQVKFSAYDFSRYGAMTGTLREISATTFTGENQERFYKGLVALPTQYVGNKPDQSILPGMTVMTDIVSGDKTIMEYLLKPIRVAVQTAFQER